MTTVAALYVQAGGAYWWLPDVEAWDEWKDARHYAGPHPVVAHPPCQRWGRYYFGGPMAKVRQTLGDDGGCFAAAIDAVRQWGGVLEHPEASHAWPAFGLAKPPRGGGWVRADDHGGWTCCVEQGHYGHKARKATWLYAVGTDRPELPWGPSVVTAVAANPRRGIVADMPRFWRAATPDAFRDVLLALARSVTVKPTVAVETGKR